MQTADVIGLFGGRQQGNGSVVVEVEDPDPDDGRLAMEAIIDGWGDDAEDLFAAGWTAEWTGSGGNGTSDVSLLPPNSAR